MKCFPSQRDKHWFTPDAFAGLMPLRGVELNSGSAYAEAFLFPHGGNRVRLQDFRLASGSVSGTDSE